MLETFRSLQRHKLIVLLVTVLTIVGLVYVFVFAPKTYQTDASMLILSPPAPPTAEQIAANPSLASINANNPYAQLQDASVVVQIVNARLATAEARKALRAAGVTGSFAITAANRSANGTLADIATSVDSAVKAQRTATGAATAFSDALRDLQKQSGVDDHYLFTIDLVVKPELGTLKVSNTLRSAVFVVVAGIFTLILAISAAEAIRQSRMTRRLSPPGTEPATESTDQVRDLRVTPFHREPPDSGPEQRAASGEHVGRDPCEM